VPRYLAIRGSSVTPLHSRSFDFRYRIVKWHADLNVEAVALTRCSRELGRILSNLLDERGQCHATPLRFLDNATIIVTMARLERSTREGVLLLGATDLGSP
jgi:hypothetical protein